MINVNTLKEYVAMRSYYHRIFLVHYIVTHCLNLLFMKRNKPTPAAPKEVLSAAWSDLVNRWSRDSSMRGRTIDSQRSRIAKAARWSLALYPATADPHQWTPSMARNFVKAVESFTIGQWNNPTYKERTARIGQTQSPRVQAQIVNAVRQFFIYSQEAGYISTNFKPGECLKTPRGMIEGCVPNPRVIQSEVWEKLTRAGRSITEEDLLDLTQKGKVTTREASYPLALVQVIAHIWLFSGLRGDEIRRLTVGCIRLLPSANYSAEKESVRRVCMLKVPVNKTSGAFEKVVSHYVGKAVATWEKQRPTSHKRVDTTSKEQVHFLLEWEGKSISIGYINQILIPLLCRKAEVSEYDDMGHITCHRARITLATRLYNRGLPFLQLQDWLGHISATSTEYYLGIDPESRDSLICESYEDAICRADDFIQREAESERTTKKEPKVIVQQAVTDPRDDLAHLRPQQKKDPQALALNVRNGLQKVQQNLLLTATERRTIIHTMGLLEQIAIRLH